MKEFFYKFLGFSLGPIVGAIIGFITIPLISHLVDADQIGMSNMFTLANNIITLIVLFGIDQAFIREYNETNDKDKLLFNSLVVPLLISILIGTMLIIFKNDFAFFLFDDNKRVIPVILLALCTPLFVMEKFFLSTLRMQEKAFQYSMWSIISKSLNLFFVIVLLLFYKRNFESIIYATVVSELIVSIILMFICRKNIRFSFKNINKRQIKSLVKFGLPLVPANLIGWGLNSTDSIFLRTMTTYSELGYYTVALKVSNVLAILQTSFSTFWVPLAFKWKSKNIDNEKFELISKGLSFTMSIILLLILLFKNFIPLFLGNGYDSVIYIVPFLLFHPIFYTMSETTILGIYFSRKTYYNIVISIISVIVNIILNYILIPNFGAVGAAIATGISYLVFFWIRTLISRKLWYRFDLMHFILVTIILVIVSLLNCVIKSTLIVAIINIVSIFIIMFVYRKIIYLILKSIKQKNLTIYK